MRGMQQCSDLRPSPFNALPYRTLPNSPAYRTQDFKRRVDLDSMAAAYSRIRSSTGITEGARLAGTPPLRRACAPHSTPGACLVLFGADLSEKAKVLATVRDLLCLSAAATRLC